MNEPHCQVYTIRHDAMGPVAGTIRRLSPDGYFIQPMINRAGDSIVFWGRARGETGFNIWRHDGALRGNDAVGCSPVEVGRGVSTAPPGIAREPGNGGLGTARPTGATASFQLRKLTDDRAVNGHPFWSAAAQHIVYFSTRGASAQTEWRMADQFKLGRASRNIWIMDRTGQNRRQLTTGAFVDERPCLSPDGQTVVFVSNRSGAMNLWSVDVATGKLRQLFHHAGLDYRPIFSPTGDRLAFFSTNNPDQSRNLCIMNWPDGLVHFPVPRGHFEWVHGPFWLADGQTLLIHAYPLGKPLHCGIWRFRLPDQHLERVIVPGVGDYAHGTIDDRQTVLAFDSHDKHHEN